MSYSSGNPYNLNQWQYYQTQQQQKQAMQQQGYTKKKDCGCGKKQSWQQGQQKNQ